MTRLDFDLCKEAVEWLIKNNVPFMDAVGVVSYAIQADKTICEAYFQVIGEVVCKQSAEDAK